MKNASADINQVLKWYSDAVNYQWKVKQKLYANDVFVGSYMVHVSVFSYRKRNVRPKIKV